MDLFLTLAVGLLAGLFLSRLAKKLGLPAVTAYLVAGIVLGPCVLGLLPGVWDGFGWVTHVMYATRDGVRALNPISEVALGFIAFSIGNEFRLDALKKTGRQATIVGIYQAVFTSLVVDVVLIGLHFVFPQQLPLSVAITLGAIAAATAPATTIMVVRQYKAEGELTSLLLPIVALDDAVGLILFSVSFGIAQGLESGTVNLISVLVDPLIEIVASLALGFLMGLIFTWAERFFHSRSKRLSISVAFVLFTVAISSLEIPLGPVTLSFSSLLSCMMLGSVFCNICNFSAELMDRLERWTAPLYVLFFVGSGAGLDLTVFKQPVIVLIGVTYVVSRCLGKYFGVDMSCAWVKCSKPVRDNLGLAMFPQGGVALGMALLVTELPHVGDLIRMITLFGVLIYELVSPYISKIALMRAGDIKEGRTSARGVIHDPRPMSTAAKGVHPQNTDSQESEHHK